MADILTAEFDIIVAGGGATGCVIAGRLAAADPSLRILVLEAGPHTREDLVHVQPARFLSHLHPSSTTVKHYVGKESEHLGGRAPVVATGQCLGGGSSINFAMYTRPAASDYDDWEKIYGNPGWGSHDLSSFLQKAETYQVQADMTAHGYSGPIKVSYGGSYTNVAQEFLDIVGRYDGKRTFTGDLNGLSSCNAYGRWQKFIDHETGRRSDTAHNYIYRYDHENLQVLTGYIVKRVIFEGSRAVGVEYVPDKRFHIDAKADVYVARARRLTVVSAGAFGSPAILERSGIGGKQLLDRLGIDTIVDLPGVGENYQDHYIIFHPFFVDDAAQTLDGIVRSDPAEIERWTAQWEKDGSGLMAHNGVDAGLKLRPSPADLDSIGSELQGRWASFFSQSFDKPLVIVAPFAGYVGDHTKSPSRKYCSMANIILYPGSVGYVHASSGHDVSAAPDFDPRFLDHAEDLAILRWSYKYGRELIRRMPCYRGAYLECHPSFAKSSSAAAWDGEGFPVSIDEPEIEYLPEDDQAIDIHIRKMLSTCWHSLGTCAMTSREDGGVVDPELNVYGVQRLKVADMSIAPANISANTYSTALAIGEKAAAIIMKELEISDAES